jgi:AraC-like DNA-binding protein
MQFDTRRIPAFARVAVTFEQLAHDGCLQVIVCASGATTSIPAGIVGLWWPLRGSAQALSGDFRVRVSRWECFVNDHQRSFDFSIRPSASAIGIVGTIKTWSTLLARGAVGGGLDPPLFPALHRITLPMRRNLFSLLRVLLRRGRGGLLPVEQYTLAAVACDLQREFEALIARCPGQNASKRRAAFLRLQRIRNLIASDMQAQFDVRAMASNASYSMWHFIRVYDAVFGETPYAHLSRCRVERARHLLSDGGRCVGDVALAVGFDNRAALTRAVKKKIGLVPSRLMGVSHVQRRSENIA